MRPHIKSITLVWRPGKSHRRIPVAVVKSNVFGTTFRYLKAGVEKAKEIGFVCFPDFPDTKEIHNVNILKVLSLRINDKERSDIQDYYKFWEVPEASQNDTYRLLAYTQGILPTDNFEFLAEYYGVKGLRFVSEITGLSKTQLENDCIHEGDELEWKLELYNEFDSKAVALYKDGQKLGYVKRIHCHAFHLPNSKYLKVRVKRIEHNGHISRALILIYDDRISVKKRRV